MCIKHKQMYLPRVISQVFLVQKIIQNSPQIYKHRKLRYSRTHSQNLCLLLPTSNFFKKSQHQFEPTNARVAAPVSWIPVPQYAFMSTKPVASWLVKTTTQLGWIDDQLGAEGFQVTFLFVVYLLYIIPGTPNNQFEVDGNGDFQAFPM